MSRKLRKSINTASNNKKNNKRWWIGTAIAFLSVLIGYLTYQLSCKEQQLSNKTYQLSDKTYQDSHKTFQDSQKKPAFKTIVKLHSFGPVKAIYEGNNITRLEILGSSRYDVEIINIGNSSAHDLQINIAPIASEHPLISTFPITNITKRVENHILYITTPVLGAESSLTFQINDVLPNKQNKVSYLFGDSFVPAFQVNIWCEEGVGGGVSYSLGLGYGAIATLKDCTFEN